MGSWNLGEANIESCIYNETISHVQKGQSTKNQESISPQNEDEINYDIFKWGKWYWKWIITNKKNVFLKMIK